LASGPEDWINVKFMVFDCPSPPSVEELFEDRIQKATARMDSLKAVGDYKPNVVVVKIQKCLGFDHLYAALADILEQASSSCYFLIFSKGGEGIMLRKPNSLYEFGKRSHAMQKLKVDAPKSFFMLIAANLLVPSICEQNEEDKQWLHCRRVYQVRFFDFLIILSHSAFGTKFALRKQPPIKVLDTITQEYTTGARPTITFKHYGLSSLQQPLYASCVQVCFDFSS
jgi:hypothetical protein